ncbi:MAG: hypothetical protein AABZ33_04035 [Chloroflexota bacterium]
MGPHPRRPTGRLGGRSALLRPRTGRLDGRGALTAARWPLPAGRYRPPEVIEAHGEDEIAALTYLVLALQELRGDERRVEIRMRARFAYVQGADAEARRVRGRGLTGEELI